MFVTQSANKVCTVGKAQMAQRWVGSSHSWLQRGQAMGLLGKEEYSQHEGTAKAKGQRWECAWCPKKSREARVA